MDESAGIPYKTGHMPAPDLPGQRPGAALESQDGVGARPACLTARRRIISIDARREDRRARTSWREMPYSNDLPEGESIRGRPSIVVGSDYGRESSR
jgi:hypothetical protein